MTPFLLYYRSVFVQQYSVLTDYQTQESWIILSAIENNIKHKIQAVGVPLKDWDISIYRGVLTGFNDAFIIDTNKKNQLIEEDPKSAEIIRPILRGRDIGRYEYNFSELWLINVHNGIKSQNIDPINIDDYPAIKEHLKKYYDILANRADKGDTPYNLRNCVYLDDFSKQKIVWSRLTRISKSDFASFPRFALIDEGYYVLDSLCFFTGENLNTLIHLLNSEYAAYYFFNSVAILDNGGMQMRQQFVEEIPLPKLTQSLEGLTQNEIDKAIYDAFNFSQEEIQFIKQYLLRKKALIQNNR